MNPLGLLYASFAKSGGDRLVWKMDTKRLRILCYHGVCEDRLSKEPWMPGYFVTQTAFDQQLRYLSRNTQVLTLSEAVARLQAGELPPRAVSLTFDDGYANNLDIAYSVLKKYNVPATVFLSTSYMESGEIFPFLKLKLIHLDKKLDAKALPGISYKSSPIDIVEQAASPCWQQVKERLTGEQMRTLRPLTVKEVQSADSKLIEFGAHTHTHCILKNENDQRRRLEIQTSIQKVAQWSGRACRFFSYPNGQCGDFGELDKQVLRAESIQAAVSGISEANGTRSELLELRRYPVSLYHNDTSFCAE